MHVPAPHPHHPFLLRPAKILPRSAKISYTLGTRRAVFAPSMFLQWNHVERADFSLEDSSSGIALSHNQAHFFMPSL